MTPLLLVACVLGQPDPVDPGIYVEHVVQGLSVGPENEEITIGVVWVADDVMLAMNRLEGTIRRIDLVDGETVTPGPIIHDLDIIQPKVGEHQSEYGVQSFTLHPDFEENGWIYIRYDKSLKIGEDTPQDVVAPDPNFSASDPTDNAIERFVWDPDANGGIGGLTFDTTIYNIVFDTRYHHGGPIVFDQDGYLFATIGDLRHQPFVEGHFGNLLTLNIFNSIPYDLAVVLRLHDDGSIPDDNPFDPGVQGTPDEAGPWYSYGVRNSFGLDVDPVTNRVWSTDNGGSEYDEVYWVEPGTNSGWRDIMGPSDHDKQEGTIAHLVEFPNSFYKEPEFCWYDTYGITAIHFLHASGLGPAYDDVVLIAGVDNKYMWALTLNDDRTGFDFKHEDLQDLVDDRENAAADPTGTPAEEILFASGIGGPVKGAIQIARGPDNFPYLLTAQGNLYKFFAGCAADHDGDGNLTILDFVAFQSDFVDGNLSADCDKNKTLNILDFVCFQSAFKAGCS